MIISKTKHSPLWLPKVAERPVLDLSKVHFDHRIKDLRVMGSWIMNRQDHREPCLVILSAHHPIGTQTPCIVPLSNAWRWAEESGDELDAAIMAVNFCDSLPHKSIQSTADITQVLSTVRSRLHDLLQMPPAPPKELEIAGHVSIHTSDERTIQKDIWDDV